MKPFQKRAALLLNLFVLLWAMLYYYPIRTTFYRASIVLTLAAIALCLTLLLWHRRWLRFLPAAIPVAFGLLVLLPGRAADPAALRNAYITALQSYEHTKYDWGGENGRGVDCSGLLRAALIDAHWHEAARTLNPALARDALWLWWHDGSAADMADGYQGRTHVIAETAPLAELISVLQPGDIAVTADRSHVLACLGHGKVIEADPSAMIVMQLNADSPWWRIKVIPCRWRCLD